MNLPIPIRPEDAAYADLYAAFIRQGRPGSLNHQGYLWKPIQDNDTLYFVATRQLSSLDTNYSQSSFGPR